MKNVKGTIILICGILSAPSAQAGGLGTFFQTVGDIASLGQTARARDKRNAEQKEAVARQKHEDEERAHQKLITDTKQKIEDKNKEIEAWKNLNEKSPEVQQALDNIIDVAAAVRAQRLNRNYYIGRIKHLFKGYSHDLEMITGLLTVAVEKPQSNLTISSPSADRRLDSAKQIVSNLQEMAAVKKEELADYVEKAANSANDETLTLFISEATILRDYVKSTSTKIDLQVKNHTDEKETLEKQLSQLTEPPKPPAPAPAPAPAPRPKAPRHIMTEYLGSAAF